MLVGVHHLGGELGERKAVDPVDVFYFQEFFQNLGISGTDEDTQRAGFVLYEKLNDIFQGFMKLLFAYCVFGVDDA